MYWTQMKFTCTETRMEHVDAKNEATAFSKGFASRGNDHFAKL